MVGGWEGREGTKVERGREVVCVYRLRFRSGLGLHAVGLYLMGSFWLEKVGSFGSVAGGQAGSG